MVSHRRRTSASKFARRNSRRTNGFRRQLALVAHRLPAKSRIPRDPPPTVPGFDYTVKVPFLVRMNWTDATTSESFNIQLPGSPLASGFVNMRSRNTIDTTIPSRSYWLDYEEIFAAAYMRATGVDLTTVDNTTKASLDFALVSVRAWGPSIASATMQMRCDGDSTVAGFAGQDNPGRNHRAAIACTYPSIGWRKFGAIDATTPAVLVNLMRINFQQFAPQAAGTTFGVATSIDMGELQLTVRMRFKLAVTTTTAFSGAKGATTFATEDLPTFSHV